MSPRRPRRWPGLRPLALLVLITVAWSADYQRLTFSDGSTKTGYFDERKGTLTLADGSTIAVRVDDIIRREDLTPVRKPLDIPPPVKPPDEQEKPAGAADQPRTLANDLDHLQRCLAEVSRARRAWIEALRRSRADPGRADDLSLAELELRRATLAADQAQTRLAAYSGERH